MSPQTPAQWRSTLLVPATAPADELVAIVAGTVADRVVLDLDDTVPPADKAPARDRLTAALPQLERAGLRVGVRVNSPDHPHCLRDVADVLSAAGAGAVESICLPRPSDARPVEALDWILDQLELELGREQRVALELQLETPSALVHSASLLAASDRTVVVTFGHGDFADAMGLPFVALDGGSPLAGHGVRVSELALFQLRLAAGSAGVVALDGPHADTPAFERRCEFARGFGFHGTWCTTEQQAELANRVFVAADAELERARDVMRATRDGAAAPADGGGYDAPLVSAARRVLLGAGELPAAGEQAESLAQGARIPSEDLAQGARSSSEARAS
ncbi:HpcH/HpaI aldolase/citrate lyase family protein [Conexibacter woesei]|uniref:HpcH/HpaI aldolase n=1 Tax=Conexibacter woesei (strain DSM 14684 / CCUG 47730 / CIP 108061 / JCM 11494 / NBRC 100937 / ID131577) TaxID=469383 RepID=D3F7I0_CONWI|nr:aldolase/citrate lyase family protein [Conexibacter woesei]ADB50842.1 HpcH/HpaI aldolase [Conexibacter woesei DSM 14684]